MILKPIGEATAKPELVKEMEALAKVLETAKWDLYPVAYTENDTVVAWPYRQLNTERGNWESLSTIIPKTLEYRGDGVFALAVAAKSPK